MDLYSFLFFLSFLGLINGFLIALMLFNRPGKQVLLSRLIASLFFLGALAMLLVTLVNANIIREYPVITTLEYFIALSVGPLLRQCVLLLLQKDKKNLKRILVHFIPAFAYLFFGALFPSISFPILWIMLHFQTYIVLSLFQYLKFRKSGSQRLPAKQQFWLTAIIAFYTLIGLSQWVRFIFSDTQLLNLIIPLTASLNFYLVLLIGFNRSIILLPGKPSFIRSSKRKSQEWAAIEEEIRQQKLYTQKGLTLSQLAFQLEIPVYHFSELLHQESQQHFPTFLNSLRVNYAKELLIDHRYSHYTIEAIANQAGFHSRSAFYQCFKKQTGLTPSAYQTSCPELENPDKPAHS